MFVVPVPTSPVPVLGAHAAGCGGPDWTSSWSDVVSWMMALAEEMFGPRDKRWFYTGLEFGDGDIPSTYYPGNRPFHVGIRLTRSATGDPPQAYFQLAHEVVHLLGPSPSREPANVLEEGMATLFQLRVSTLAELGYNIAVPSYLRAMGAVNELLKISPDAVHAIRAEHPDLRQVTGTDLMRIVPEVTPELATALCAPFSR
jgi:hypothetical protein